MGSGDLTWQYVRRLLSSLGACVNLFHSSPYCPLCDGLYAFVKREMLLSVVA